MQDKYDRDSGVTYIGPRSFVAGFAIVCGMFVAIVYGANRIMGSPETPVPISASIGFAGVPTTIVPAVASRPLASPQLAPTWLVSPRPARPRSAATAQLARPTLLATPQLAKRGSFASPRPAHPVSREAAGAVGTTALLRTRLAPVATRAAAATAHQAVVEVSPQLRSSAIVARITPPRHRTPARPLSGTSVAQSGTGDTYVARRAAPLGAIVVRNTTTQVPMKRLRLTLLSQHSLHERFGVPSPTPRKPKPPASIGPKKSDRRAPSSPGLLVPFKTAALTPNGALEPRLADRAPLVISPAAKR